MTSTNGQIVGSTLILQEYITIFSYSKWYPLDADSSQIDFSSRGKYSVPIMNMELWENELVV